MLALIQWTKGKKINIVPSTSLLDSKKENETTLVKWGLKKHQATIKKISGKF